MLHDYGRVSQRMRIHITRSDFTGILNIVLNRITLTIIIFSVREMTYHSVYFLKLCSKGVITPHKHFIEFAEKRNVTLEECEII